MTTSERDEAGDENASTVVGAASESSGRCRRVRRSRNKRRRQTRDNGAAASQRGAAHRLETSGDDDTVTRVASTHSPKRHAVAADLVMDFADDGHLILSLPTSGESTSSADDAGSIDETRQQQCDLVATADIERDNNSPGDRSSCFSDKNSRVLFAMMVMVGAFAVAEVVGGGWTGSLALMSDAFHMLSDLISLVVGFVAIRLATRARSPTKSYGWQRAEIIGALVNGVFLQSACFFIALEAVMRIVSPVDVQQPYVVLVVGVAGLVVNLIGMALFCSHRTLSQHHGHSHAHAHSHGDNAGDVEEHGGGGNLNMHGVFLHVLGDALGSLVVIATAIVYAVTDAIAANNADVDVGTSMPWRVYIDPVCSLVLAAFIFRSSVPLVRRSVHILMQSVPRHVDMDALRGDVAAVDGVLGVHALHVWQMTDRRAVGSVHVACRRDATFDPICRRVKRVLHRYDVHETAVQPEFVDIGHDHRHQDASGANACENDAYWCQYGRRRRASCCNMTTSSSSSSSSSNDKSNRKLAQLETCSTPE